MGHLSTGIESLEFMGEAFYRNGSILLMDFLKGATWGSKARDDEKSYDIVYSQQDMTTVIVTGTNETGNIDFYWRRGTEFPGE